MNWYVVCTVFMDYGCKLYGWMVSLNSIVFAGGLTHLTKLCPTLKSKIAWGSSLTLSWRIKFSWFLLFNIFLMNLDIIWHNAASFPNFVSLSQKSWPYRNRENILRKMVVQKTAMGKTIMRPNQFEDILRKWLWWPFCERHSWCEHFGSDHKRHIHFGTLLFWEWLF